MTHYAQVIFRFAWVLVGTAACCAIALPGYAHFETGPETLMLVTASPLAINQGAPPEALHPKRHLIEYYHWHHNRPRRRSPGFAARGADSFKVLSAICQSGNSSGWKMAAMLDSSWPSSLPRQRRSFPGVSQWPTLSGGAGIGVLPMTHLAARQRPFDHSKVLPTLLFSCANQ